MMAGRRSAVRRNPGEIEGQRDHHPGAILAGRTMHHRRARGLEDGTQRSAHRVRSIIEVPEVMRAPEVGIRPSARTAPRQAKHRLVADRDVTGDQREVVVANDALKLPRRAAFKLAFERGAQVHDIAHGILDPQPSPGTRAQILQVVSTPRGTRPPLLNGRPPSSRMLTTPSTSIHRVLTVGIVGGRLWSWDDRGHAPAA